jgi:hypothetical protein
MARVCHTNNCPVGVASQREELRARFPGAPADLVNFFAFVAEEVRGEEGGGGGSKRGAGLWGIGQRPTNFLSAQSISPPGRVV